MFLNWAEIILGISIKNLGNLHIDEVKLDVLSNKNDIMLDINKNKVPNSTKVYDLWLKIKFRLKI